jgi:hypothetical protein
MTKTKDFTEAAKIWAAGHPDVVAYTTKLVESGVDAAVFSSVVRAIADIALDTQPYMAAGDVDLLIVKKHLPRAAELLPQVTGNRHKVIHDRGADGVLLAFAAHEITGRTGNDEVQFVTPLTHVVGIGHNYSTAYSAEAHQHSTIIETDQGLLPIAHLALTAGMYGILQRPNKDDDIKAATILQASDVMNDPYVAVTAETMGWDSRVYDFLGVAALCAEAEAYKQPVLAIA